MVIAHFESIRSKILFELENARKSIYVAVYWFTNQELFNKLLEKLNKGVEVKLILHNDYVNNRETGLRFQQLVDCGCDFYFSDLENPMHNKFCVIDNETLINGSYNWTYYAESRNNENVLIIKDETDVILAFKNEFFRLIKLLEPLKSISYITKFEVEENNLLRTRDYLAHDIVYQAKAINKPELVQNAFDIAPNNLSVQKVANDLKLIRQYKLKYTVGVSLVNDGIKIMAKKGASLPATFSTIVRTATNNQPKSMTDIVYGEAGKASENTILVKMTLDGLPLKPAGKAEVKFTFSIDIDGKLKVEKMSLDNGKKEIWEQRAEWLIEKI